ncbi:MAG: filamentous hemagglutinin N-terminal domain-containing protein, partial [Aeromonas salmonicida]
MAQPGVILNNATGQLTQTQLGGLIQNNPHLTGQAANVIINEVVGANPSQLQGYLEVAGQQAGVVVANPNGLTCDGCGFINTPNVTLSTGKPVLDAGGQLQMLDVKQGTLTVGGKGLDASRQASIDLVARAVQLNGALHGKEVNVIAGANRVNRQTGEISAQQGEGAVPEVAIDTAAMGGMYAGKIRLVSTEAGVGVNLANVVASQGDLMLDASGKVRLRDSSSAGALQVKGKDNLALVGTIQAGGAAHLKATGELTAQDADITAEQDVTLAARTVRLNRGKVTSGGALSVQAGDELVTREGALQGDSIDARARHIDNQALMTARQVTLQAEKLRQAGEIQGTSVRLAGGSLRHEGTTRAVKTLEIDAHQLDNRGELKSGQSLTVALGDRGNNEGLLSSAGSLDVRAANQWDQGAHGKSEAGGSAHLQAGQARLAGEVTAQALDIHTNGLTVSGKVRGKDVRLQADKLNNSGEIQAGQTLTWQGDVLDNSGNLQGDKQLVLKGATLTNKGTLAGGDSLTVLAGKLSNGGRIASQDVALDARQLSSDGTLLGVSRLTLKGDELVLTGQQLTDGELQLGSRLLQLSGQTVVGGKVKVVAEQGKFDGLLKAQSLVLDVGHATSEGKLHSREGVSWQGQRLTTGNMSELLANQGVSLSGDQLALGGTVGAGNTLDIKGKQVSQTGALASGQTISINAGELALAGQVQGHTIALTSDHGTQGGRLLAVDKLTWHSKQLEGNGWMQAGNTLAMTGDNLTHHGTAVTQGNMAITFAELNSAGGLFAHEMALTGSRLVLTGELETKKSAQLQANELQLGGVLRTGSDLTLGATLLTLSGTQNVDGTLQLQAEQAALTGEMEVGKQLKIDTRTLNSSGKQLAQQADITAAQWEQQGSLTTENTLVWRGTRLMQQADGVLQGGSALTLLGDEVTLAGMAASKGDMTIAAK